MNMSAACDKANLVGYGAVAGRRALPAHLEHWLPSPLVAWQRRSPLSVLASSPPAMVTATGGRGEEREGSA